MSITRETSEVETPSVEPVPEAKPAPLDTADRSADAQEELLQEGKRRFKDGDIQAAADCFRQLLTLDGSNKAAWNNLGVAMHVQNKWNDAVEAFAHALAIDVSDLSIRHNLRTLLMDTDHDGRMDADILVKYGESLHRVGKIIDASEQFALAVQSDPQNSEAWNNLGVTLLQIGSTAEAENALRHALTLNEHDTNARNNLATLLAMTDRRDDALECFGQVLELDPMDELAKSRMLEFDLATEEEIADLSATHRARIALAVLAELPDGVCARNGYTLTPVEG